MLISFYYNKRINVVVEVKELTSNHLYSTMTKLPNLSEAAIILLNEDIYIKNSPKCNTFL